MRTRLKLVLALVVIATGVTVFEVNQVLKRRAREQREKTYQITLQRFRHDLPLGMMRKDVENYLRARDLAARQTCCVDMKKYQKGTWDDFVKIGQEDAPWYCNSTEVYVGLQFTGPGDSEGMWRANEQDKLEAVTLVRQFDRCL